MHYLEKQAYEREMQVLQKKLEDLQRMLDEKDQVICMTYIVESLTPFLSIANSNDAEDLLR